MKLLTKAIEKKLRHNHDNPGDHKPVVKFFNPCGAATWLITEIYPDNDTMFGLCDLGMGSPELGYVSLREMASIRTKPFGLPIERDRHFKANKTISSYADEAREIRRIEA
jgi:hypothetical protein